MFEPLLQFCRLGYGYASRVVAIVSDVLHVITPPQKFRDSASDGQ